MASIYESFSIQKVLMKGPLTLNMITVDYSTTHKWHGVQINLSRDNMYSKKNQVINDLV